MLIYFFLLLLSSANRKQAATPTWVCDISKSISSKIKMAWIFVYPHNADFLARILSKSKERSLIIDGDTLNQTTWLSSIEPLQKHYLTFTSWDDLLFFKENFVYFGIDLLCIASQSAMVVECFYTRSGWNYEFRILLHYMLICRPHCFKETRIYQ